MMNILAVGLLLSSLAAAGLWSPHPHHSDGKEESSTSRQPFIKQGHRIIVVEYETESIPNTQQTPSPASNILEEAKDKIKDAASLLPNVGQGIASPDDPTPSARDWICDAYGTCKEKVSGILGQTKEKVSDTVSEAQEAAKDVAEGAARSGEAFAEKAKEAFGSAVDGGERVVEKAKEAIESAVEVEEVDEDGSVGNPAIRRLVEIIRRGCHLAYAVAVKAVSLSSEMAGPLMSGLHMLAIASCYGTGMWVTFGSSQVLAKALPRQQFGLVQSKIYPVYFRSMTVGIGLTFLFHVLNRRHSLWDGRKADIIQGYNLLGSLGLVLANMFYLDPLATKVMFQRFKLEKEEGKGRDITNMGIDSVRVATVTATTTAATAAPTAKMATAAEEAFKKKLGSLSRRLKKLNTYSSFLNVLTLMGLTWHLVYLGQIQKMTC